MVEFVVILYGVSVIIFAFVRLRKDFAEGWFSPSSD